MITDPLLGSLTYDDDEGWWVAKVEFEGSILSLTIEGDEVPDPALVPHARDIVRAIKELKAKVRAFSIAKRSGWRATPKRSEPSSSTT